MPTHIAIRSCRCGPIKTATGTVADLCAWVLHGGGGERGVSSVVVMMVVAWGVGGGVVGVWVSIRSVGWHQPPSIHPSASKCYPTTFPPIYPCSATSKHINHYLSIHIQVLSATTPPCPSLLCHSQAYPQLTLLAIQAHPPPLYSLSLPTPPGLPPFLRAAGCSCNRMATCPLTSRIGLGVEGKGRSGCPSWFKALLRLALELVELGIGYG